MTTKGSVGRPRGRRTQQVRIGADLLKRIRPKRPENIDDGVATEDQSLADTFGATYSASNLFEPGALGRYFLSQ